MCALCFQARAVQGTGEALMSSGTPWRAGFWLSEKPDGPLEAMLLKGIKLSTYQVKTVW